MVFSFISFFVLSWILLFRDPRALIGISNFYPGIKDFLFSAQILLSQYGLNTIPTIAFAFTAIAALIAYVLSLTQKISLKNTILFACIFQAITFFSFPILSTDIFSYIFSERVSTVHHENIWQVKPAVFPDDQFGVLADWKDTTSVYGGVHYLLYLIPSLIGQNDLLTLVVLYKIIPAIFAIGAMAIFYSLLVHFKMREPERMLRFVFWNPLLILELLGSGHNDSMMLFFTLLSIFFYYRKAWLFAGIAIALAVQIKLIPLVLFFFGIIALLRNKKNRDALVYAGGFIVINSALFIYMQVSLVEFVQRVAYNGGVYWQSLQTIIQTFTPGQSGFVVYVFLLWLAYYTLRSWKNVDPVYAYVVVLLVYLIFVSAAYWNWYVLWLFPLVPFIANRKVAMTVLKLSATSLLAYPLLWIIHRINTPSPIWPVMQYLFIFGPPIAVYLLASYKKVFFNTLLKRLRLHDLIAEKA